MNTLDRSEINRALAKAIAYQQCGQPSQADAWIVRLVRLLDGADLLSLDARNLIAGEV